MLIRHIPWDSQPQQSSEVNWGHPLSRGLVSLWSAASNFDSAANRLAVYTAGTGISVLPGAGGISKYFSGNGTGKITTTIPADTTACTYVFTVSDLFVNSALGRVVSTYNGAGGHDVFLDTGVITLQEFFTGSNAQHTIALVGTTGRAVTVAVSMSGVAGVTPTAYVDGIPVTVTTASAGTGTRIAGGTTLGIGCRPDSTARQLDRGKVYDVAMFNYAASASTLAELSSKPPWQLYSDVRFYIPVSVSGGGVTGTLATTNANDTVVATGSTTIVGTLARTNADDTSAASGSTTIVGTLVYSNANDTVVASGHTTVTGTLAYTNINDSVVASGSTTNSRVNGPSHHPI